MLRQFDTKHFAGIATILVALFLVTEAMPNIAPSFQNAAFAQEQDDVRPAAGADNAAEKPKNLLVWTFDALGWRYTISFLGISLAFLALVIMNSLSVRRDALVPQHLVDSFDSLCSEKKYQEAYELARTDESFLGQMLSAGLARLQQGYAQAIEGMQEVGEEENMKLEHRLSYVAMIGTLAPMVGLLGTVDGMIMSFNVIATSKVAPPPSQLAAGISTALVTTLVGLVIAIPAIAFFNIMKNRMAHMVLQAGIVSEGLMNRFESVAPRK